MDDGVKRFERFRQEHARLHDPALVRGAVELVPVEPGGLGVAPAAGGKGKDGRRGKRDRRKIAPDAAGTSSQPEGAELLSAGLLRELRGGGRAAAPGEPAPAGTPQERPRIEVEPLSVARRLGLFEEEDFALDAPSAQRVELVWREAPEFAGRAGARGQWQRVVMDHSQAARFETRVGVKDGTYLYAFAVDGHMRPAARSARRVLISADGLFAPLTLARYEQVLTLTNDSEIDEMVTVETDALWLVPERESVHVPARGSTRLRVRFHLPAASAGLNESVLRLGVAREGGAVPAGAVRFAAQVEAGGALPEFSFTPRELGQVMQGIDEPSLRVAVTARGRGTLKGMVSLPHSGELIDFSMNAEEGVAHFEHTFRVESGGLPKPHLHGDETALKVMLITDSYLANYRLCRAEVPYRLVYLKKSLPALSFGMVRPGGTKVVRLDVTRSDGQELELEVGLPSGAAPYLEAYQARANAYVFRLSADSLAPGASVSELVELIDRRSGLRSQIKVLANIADSVGGATGPVTP